ncbi:MAG: chromate efflux transporter [Pseudomonadales bacterium]
MQKIGMTELFRVFLRIGLLSFGGPAAQIALMHRELVERRAWLNESQFLNALGFCMLLPGPEAMQLATYAGWRLRGTLGGLMAGLLFVLPGAVVILALAVLYVSYAELHLVTVLFLGIKAAVVAVVIQALLRIAGKALIQRRHWLIAGLSFIALFFFALPFPIVVLCAALLGYFSSTNAAQGVETAALPRKRTAVNTAVLGAVVWFTPLVLVALLGAEQLLLDVAAFFSKLAVVTFGGAYAVLVYMAQDVVSTFGWLEAPQMIDALGLAETTPGPLILVTEFVGFLAGYNQGGLVLGIAAAALTLWVTFVPCFIWIFCGAPYLDWLAGQTRLKSALAAITAAVVGVMLNLSIWFALHVLFAEVDARHIGPLQLWQPQWQSLNLIALGLCALGALLLFKLRFGVVRLLLSCAALSWALSSFAVFA